MDETTTTPERRTACAVLALAGRSLTRAQRLGWRPGSIGAVARLLYLHRNALRSELAGQVERADFWWEHLRAQWKSLPAEHPGWVELRNQIGEESRADPAAIRALVGRELLIDTHLAFHNGLLPDNGKTYPPRARQHFQWAADIAGTLSPAEQSDLIARKLRLHIELHAAAQEWDQLFEQARQFVHHASDLAAEERWLSSILVPAVKQLVGDNKWTAARRLMTNLHKLFPESHRQHVLLVRFHMQAIKHHEQKKEWKAALEDADQLTEVLGFLPALEQLRIRIRLDAIASWSGKSDESGWTSAIECASALCSEYPAQPQFRRLLIDLHRKAFDYYHCSQGWGKMLETAQKLADLHPDQPVYVERVRRLYQEAKEQLATAGLGRGSALSLAETMLRMQPFALEPLEDLIRYHVEDAVEDLAVGANKEEASRGEAERIGRHIQVLEQLRKSHSHAFSTYEALAVLYHVQAVKLANGDRPTEALVAVARALAFKPDWEQARHSEQQIEQLLKKYQEQISQLQRETGSDFRRFTMLAVLQPAMHAIISDVARGVRARDEFRSSGEPARILKQMKKARARHFWLRVGLPIPDVDWDESARVFDEATDELLSSKPEGPTELLLRWSQIVQDRPDSQLDEIDVSKLLAFLYKLDPSPLPPIEEPVEEPAPEIEPGEYRVSEADILAQLPPATEPGPEANPESRTVGPVPKLAPQDSSTVRQTGAVPFEFWLFSRRDSGAKAMLTLALLLLLFVGVLALRERIVLAQRNRAFTDLQAAADSLDEKAGRDALDRFRDTRALTRRDRRLSAVENIAAEIDEWPNLRKRNAAYNQLTDAIRRSEEKTDSLALLQPAEAFLEATPGKGLDPRTEEVLDWYDRAFADWLAGQSAGPVDPQATSQITRYNTLLSAISRRKDARP
jgi:hypothetical protein